MAGTDPKSKAACPSCQARFVIPEGMVGKKAKCPKCGQPFIITKDESPPTQVRPTSSQAIAAPPGPPAAASLSPSPAPTPSIMTSDRTSSTPPARTVTLPWWVVTFGAPALALVLGYFLGREHLKYQMRSALADIGKDMAEGMKAIGRNAFPGMREGDSGDEPVAPKPQVPQIAMAETYDAGRFTVQVVAAKIGPTRLRDFRAETFDSDSAYLQVAVLFRNKDDRKSLRFSGEKGFNIPRFQMRDDVDNIVRPVGFGISTKVVGAIPDMEELNPEESLQHIQVFEVPLPKTKSLTLTIDLGCFDGEGELKVEIPYEAVEKPQS